MKKNRDSALCVSNNKRYSLTLDVNGVARVDKLVIVDQSSHKEWELIIRDGVIHIEPYDLDRKREWRINKIFKNKKNGNTRTIR